MAGAEPRAFVHIVSGGGLRDPAERLRKLQCMLYCTHPAAPMSMKDRSPEQEIAT